MTLYKVSRFIAILATATFAGLMYCFLVVVDRMLAVLDAKTYAMVMQELIKAADVPPVVPIVVILILISSLSMIISLRKHIKSRAFILSLTGFLVFFVFSFLVTVVLNVPVNNYIASWNPGNPPSDWSQTRATWDSFNYWRVGSSFIALICFILASRQDPVIKEIDAK
jgi:uncharacterized membrane protein